MMCTILDIVHACQERNGHLSRDRERGRCRTGVGDRRRHFGVGDLRLRLGGVDERRLCAPGDRLLHA